MKLDQLGLTQAGKKATKKLGSQVHKATVAAGPDVKLKLGVVGIEIGQEQSKGPTSITEEASNPRTLITKLSQMMNVKIHRKSKDDVDLDEAAQDAVSLFKIWMGDNTRGNNLRMALSNIRMYLKGNGVFQQLNDANLSLAVFGLKPPDWFQDGLDGNATLVQKSKAMTAHVDAVEEIVDFLSLAHSSMMEQGDETWKSHGPFVRAVFRKLRIL